MAAGPLPPGAAPLPSCRWPLSGAAGHCGQDVDEVIETLRDSPERCGRVVDQFDGPELRVGAATKLVGSTRDVGPALLPHAAAGGLPGGVEGVEVRVRRRVHAADAGVRVGW